MTLKPPADSELHFTLSSLQPLSTLQQLELLHLWDHACTATSLQGLAGLSNLKVLRLEFDADDGRLRTWEGISPGVIYVSISVVDSGYVSLVGIQGCTSIKELSLNRLCCLPSFLQPLGGSSGLKLLQLDGCSMTSLEGLNSMSLESL
jgi:hypothetical protein